MFSVDLCIYCLCMYVLQVISKLDRKAWLEIQSTFPVTLLISLCLSRLLLCCVCFRTSLKDLFSHLVHKHVFCFSVCPWCSPSNRPFSLHFPLSLSPASSPPHLLFRKALTFTVDHADETHSNGFMTMHTSIQSKHKISPAEHFQIKVGSVQNYYLVM